MARPRQISDAQILRATKACVLEHGPSVSLEIVAEQLGVTSPALLKRFGNRHALFLQALKPPAEPDWVKGLEAGPDGRPLATQLEDTFRQMSQFFIETIPCMSALRESGLTIEDIQGARKTHPATRAVRAVTRWLEKARQRGLVQADELETAAAAMLGAVTMRIWLAHLLKYRPGEASRRDYLHELAQLFARSLSAPSTPVPPAVKKRGTS